ncbi:NXPE family member 3-like isoform X1 [Heterodontus francisci]|uniref:NXPE family member 3-like isoform X1 n=2 Tax=Heterodontus francisci TaxID=7792 RepID=UPI00355C2391
MDEKATKITALSSYIYRSLFTFLVLITLLLLILNVYNIKYDESSNSGSESKWRRYPTPKIYPAMRQKVEAKKLPWTYKLVKCGYQNHSFTPEERSEGTFLLKMIEWPKASKSAVPFLKSSDPSHAHFVILNSAKTFYVGDQLQVMLQMNDFEGHPKQYGGDYLQARIHTPALKAGSAGTVIDNQNGSYLINFNLSWPGKVEVSVSLVHPSEGVQVLERLREEHVQRVYFKSAFKYGGTSETTVCSLCFPQSGSLCNFTDSKTGDPWFCYKPKKLPCTARISHAHQRYENVLLNGEESRYFQSGVNIKKPILPSGTGYIMVEPSPRAAAVLGECIRGKPLVSPSGFYYKDQWMSKTCNIRRFDTPAKITDCLRQKKIYLFGDSTIRQWFAYLSNFVPGPKMFNLGNPSNTGPHLAVDLENNILVEYHAHGPPVQLNVLSSQHLKYISNALDEIKGGKDTVIGITLWAHVTTYSVEVYIRRLQNIRRSIVQLLGRNPDTVVVIKTANVRALTQHYSLYHSDWYSYQFDLVMRKMFTGINVAFADAWEMTLAHYLPHDIHPKQVIIKNEIDVFLSYVCPSEKR